MRIEITPKDFQVRLYGDDPDNYVDVLIFHPRLAFFASRFPAR